MLPLTLCLAPGKSKNKGGYAVVISGYNNGSEFGSCTGAASYPVMELPSFLLVLRRSGKRPACKADIAAEAGSVGLILLDLVSFKGTYSRACRSWSPTQFKAQKSTKIYLIYIQTHVDDLQVFGDRRE